MDHYPFENTPLPYAYNALEPYIDELTMHLHHDRHLQTYVDNLNAALRAQPQLQNMTLEQLIRVAPSLPENVGVPVSRNAGGVYNHRFYFEGLSPSSARNQLSPLSAAIDQAFGSFGAFKEKFGAAALSVFGSGYAWLVLDSGKLRIMTTPNQDTPLPRSLCPILTIDVWEHAYYLKHYNKRGDYIADWWNIVNWAKAEERYAACRNPQRA